MKFRISPYGTNGWTVEREKIEVKYLRVGFFFKREERREIPVWKEVFLLEYPGGLQDLRTSLVNTGDSRWVQWPKDKDKVKKILDKFIDREKVRKKLEEDYERAVSEHRKNNPPEDYP